MGPRRRGPALLLLSVLEAATLLQAPPVQAAEGLRTGATRFAMPAQVRSPRIRSALIARLDAVQQAADAGRLDEALGLLDAIRRDHDGGRALNAYERANLYYFYGFIQDARGDREAAARAYAEVLAQRGLPTAMAQSTRFSLAQVQAALGQWEKAAGLLEAWLRAADTPTPEAHALLARALHELGRESRALAEIDKALRLAREENVAPQEGWYLVMRAAAYANGDLPRTARTLEELAARWPRKDYFLQLSAIYAETGDVPRRVAAMEAAWLAGWLQTEPELLGLAYLYLDAGLPLRAAAMLEQEIAAGRVAATAANLELAGTAWRQAREPARAIVKWQAAAALAKDAGLWLRLAGLQLDDDRPADAAEAVRAALALGGGERPDSARLLLGTALYRLGRLEEARDEFRTARRDPRSRQEAAQWLRYLDAEMARREMAAGSPG